MTPDLSDDEKRALIELLTHTIEDDLYPLSPRIRTPKPILAKHGKRGRSAGLSAGKGAAMTAVGGSSTRAVAPLTPEQGGMISSIPVSCCVETFTPRQVPIFSFNDEGAAQAGSL
jgi:hypothetical protein